MTSRMTDALSYALALGLALGCLSFAGYKVIMLRSMENPPADMGLNFPPSKRKFITDDSIQVDSLVTRSTSTFDAASRQQARPMQPYTRRAPIRDYRLLTVIDGVAFVEMSTLEGKEIRPVAVGNRLPGADMIERIERIDGRWMLVAGDVKLVAERH